MTTEEEAVRPSVIKRLECDAHGDVLEGGNAAVRWCPDHGCHVKPVERVYWAADEVLEALLGAFSARTAGPEYADFLERRFSGEGAS